MASPTYPLHMASTCFILKYRGIRAFGRNHERNCSEIRGFGVPMQSRLEMYKMRFDGEKLAFDCLSAMNR